VALSPGGKLQFFAPLEVAADAVRGDAAAAIGIDHLAQGKGLSFSQTTLSIDAVYGIIILNHSATIRNQRPRHLSGTAMGRWPASTTTTA
jgi:hypothetical protein